MVIYERVEQGCLQVIKAKDVQLPIEENRAQYEKSYTIFNELYQNLKKQLYAFGKSLNMGG